MDGKKLIALTFDDGPNTTTTIEILDILERKGVVATFFLVGEKITDQTKPVMERELNLGCEFCNHSWTHSFMNKLTVDEIKQEIKDTSEKIFETVGVTPKFFRPPYIATSPEMYEVIDLPFINGINCSDWDASVTADSREKVLLSQAKDGDIVLLHDFTDNINTVQALENIIDGLWKDNFELVTLSQLFEIKGINPNIKNKMWSNIND